MHNGGMQSWRLAAGWLILALLALLGGKELASGAPHLFAFTLGSAQTRYGISTRLGGEPLVGLQYVIRYGYKPEGTTAHPVERLLRTVQAVEELPENAGRSQATVLFRRNQNNLLKWEIPPK